MNKIDVLIVEPLKEPYVKKIDNELKSLQAEVGGGYIECVPFDETDYSITLVCDDEGKLKGLTGNRQIGKDIIAGTFFITKSNEEGEFISLSKGEIDKYTERFKEPELFTQGDVCNAFIFEVSYGSEDSDEDLEL